MFKAFFVILILIISMYVDHRIIDLRSFELANIKVEVKGNGATNGIYTLPKYSMLEDLLPMIALKDNADLSSYNRQQPLKDKDVIHIDIYQKPAKISINAASLQQLCTLEGIKEKTAQKIIEYRQKNGPFQTLEELLEVPGIGNAKFMAIKDYICL